MTTLSTTWFTWATVTATGAGLRVKLDGDGAALPFAPDCLVDASSLAVGDRVRCEVTGGRVVVLGRPGGAAGDPRAVTEVAATGADANALLTAGSWGFSGAATAAASANLPVAGTPGRLDVVTISHGSFVQQTFTTRDGQRVFSRGSDRTVATPVFTAWVELTNTETVVALLTPTGWTTSVSGYQRPYLLVRGKTVTLVGGLLRADTANSLTAGTAFTTPQLIPTGYAPPNLNVRGFGSFPYNNPGVVDATTTGAFAIIPLATVTAAAGSYVVVPTLTWQLA